MFNFEQLCVDSSFTLVKPDAALTDVQALLKRYHFVIMEDSLTYVIADEEHSQLELSGHNVTVKEWINRVKWSSSPVCSISKLAEYDLTWERPVVIGETLKDIQGIATADAIIRCLFNEKKQATSYLYTLAETVNDAVTAVDRQGRVICWNKVAEKVYGIKKEEIIGRKLGEHFDKESIMLHRILDEGRTVRQAYHQPAPGTHVLISASPIIENNQIIGGIATEQDITRIFRLNEELHSIKPSGIEQDKPFTSMIGAGNVFKRVLESGQKFAQISTPVLLIGEPGSGKERLARAIHDGGERKNGPFLFLHCGVIPEGLLDTELFGYEGGVFTNEEEQGKAGKLELADGGTILLKDIRHMPMSIQLKLIQFLKNKFFHRIGGAQPVFADTRIIATAPFTLRPLMEQGQFLEDLFYQLNAMSIEMPPLRERIEDIPELVQAFIREFSIQHNKLPSKIDADAITALMNYDWPGNIGELRNVVERIVILGDGDTITMEHLPKGLVTDLLPGNGNSDDEEFKLKTRLSDQNENVLIHEALRKAYGNKSAAAKLLGISRGTLYNKMKEYGINL